MKNQYEVKVLKGHIKWETIKNISIHKDITVDAKLSKFNEYYFLIPRQLSNGFIYEYCVEYLSDMVKPKEMTDIHGIETVIGIFKFNDGKVLKTYYVTWEQVGVSANLYEVIELDK